MAALSSIRDFALITVDIVPYLLPGIDALIWLLTGNGFAFADVWFLLVNMGINFGLRKLMGTLFPNSKWVYVPEKCAIRCAAKTPGFLEQCGSVIDMPSFHAQMVGHYSLYWLMVLATSVDSQLASVRKIAGMVILLIIIFLLMYARYFIGCSTLVQLATGFIVGAVVGVLSFVFLHAVVKATAPRII